MAKPILSLTVLCALAICASPTLCEARKGHWHHHTHSRPHEGKFVKTKGTKFVLRGAPFLFNGFNSYWMMTVAADPAQRRKVTEVFQRAAVAGMSVCRAWAFSDGGDQALQTSPGVYSEQVFQGLDFVIAEARRHGIRLILSLVNNYKDYGGKAQYVEWARNAGASVNGEDDFYTDDVVKGYYKNHVNAILNRHNTITNLAYKDDAMIMAWELMNEPRCDTDYSGRTVNSWVQEMASYTKSLDRKHLVEVGMEGFYGDSVPQKKQHNPGYEVGTDFIADNLIEEVDFATIHAYPDQWLSGQSDDAHAEFVRQWMWSHWNDSKTLLKKPLAFTEFGKSEEDPGRNRINRDEFFSMVYRNIYGCARAGGSMGGGLVWQLMADGMEPYHDGYEVVLSRDASTGDVISRHSRAMAQLANMIQY